MFLQNFENPFSMYSIFNIYNYYANIQNKTLFQIIYSLFAYFMRLLKP